jgi:hypothetical protein
LEDLGVNERIGIKMDLKETGCGPNSAAWEWDPVAGSWEHDNGPWDPVRHGEFLDQLCDYHLLNKDSSPCI